MAKLTKTEQRAYNALLHTPGRSLPIDLLIERVYDGHAPASARAGMAAIMRSVVAKTEGWPVRVVRSSGLGRGAMAVYQLQDAAG